jgi:protein-disulfide isomerase
MYGPPPAYQLSTDSMRGKYETVEVPASWPAVARPPYLSRMKALVFCAVLLAACRPADGGTQAAPPRGATASAPSTAAAAPPAAGDANALLARADAGRIQGDTSAPVWLVEISDFQCPFCKRWHDETYPAIRRDYIQTGIVRMAYVHLPLSIHPHAEPAAEAAMCASVQGRFWPVHDAIFRTQDHWTPMPDARAVFDSLALAAGVDAAQYRRCMESDVMLRLINGDRERAAAASARSTPTFFVGGERIEGAAPRGATAAAAWRRGARWPRRGSARGCRGAPATR